MKLVKVSNHRLQIMREKGWKKLVDVFTFYGKYDIDILTMVNMYVIQGTSQCKGEERTNRHHY